MSYFVFGRVAFSISSGSVMDRVACNASIEALKTGAAVQFGSAIVQRLIFEIVGNYDPAADWLPFLMTDSPLSNVSEGLIFSFGLDRAEADARFQQNAARIGTFLRSILAEREVSRIDLFVSDAAHPPYPTRTISAESIERELLAEWEQRDEKEFSFCLVIPKARGASGT